MVLRQMAGAAVACYDKGKAKGQLPTRDELRAAIKAEDRETTQQPRPLPDFADHLARMVGLYAANTIKSHNTTYQHIQRYASLSRRPLEYAHLSRDWAERFGAWLSAGAGVREHMADSSVNKQLKLFKEFLADAADRGRTPRIDVKGWGWEFVEPEVMALTVAELNRIEALEGLPPYLENARCLWLLMAYTGLRFSDAMKLRPEYDKGDVLQLVPQKTTDIPATIYIRKATRALLNKCWTGEVHEIANSTLNEYIKMVCQRAGIDEPVEKITYYGQTSRPKKQVFKKYELVTCHTARRTHITHSFGIEIPLELIMLGAGHKNPKTTLRYNQNTVARQVAVNRRAWGEED